MVNENLMEYINALAKSDESENALILSTLDHTLSNLSWKKRLEFFSCYMDEDIFNKLSIMNKSWLSGLAEYIFNQRGKTPPAWALNEDNKLHSVEANVIYEIFKKINPAEAHSIMVELLNASIPEMRKRNIIAESVFDSF